VLGQLDLNRLDDRSEQPLLRPEMMGEGATRHPGSFHDVLLPRAGEAVLGEQFATGLEQGTPGRRPSFGLRASARLRRILVDTHGTPKYKGV